MNILRNGRRITYQKIGKGTTIVFLHGFCEDLSMWDDFEPGWTSDDYQVIAIDLAGFGHSDLDPALSMDSMAQDVRAVLKEEAVESCILIGHSMGGYVGLAFAELYPGFLKGLCLFHSHPFADTEAKKPARKKSIDFVRRRGARLFVHQLIPDLFPPAFNKARPDFVKELVLAAEQIDSEAVALASQAMLDRKDRSAVLEQIDCPVLFIVGDEDNAVPFELSLSMVYLPKIANIKILRGVGHMGMFEAKGETETMVREFVEFCG